MGLTNYHNKNSKRLPGFSLIRIFLRTFSQFQLKMPKVSFFSYECLNFNSNVIKKTCIMSETKGKNRN